MHTPHGQLTYCSNIHPGETWEEHFEQLKQHIPQVKKKISPHQPFGIGLRLSNNASIALQQNENLIVFLQWLRENNCYVFTMNGFPYGSFHHSIVKDQVHAPDWTTRERLDYTTRLADILSALLLQGLEGGISTSPLSYRHWYTTDQLKDVMKQSTDHVLELVMHLIRIKEDTGKTIHVDIEPEPDGLLESGMEFIHWYDDHLLPACIKLFQQHLGWTYAMAENTLKEHVRLCYDICHFAVGYENHEQVTMQLRKRNIAIGKIQVSAAVKALLPANEKRHAVVDAFRSFNEPTYLHQVIALQNDGALKHYRDLPEAITLANDPLAIEWRSHFHVPLFVEHYGVLQSTQQDILTVLQLHREHSLTNHLEIETYTWEVLPDALKLPITDSIIRELEWVQERLK